MGDGQAVTCMSDPRCVAPEHYVAPEGGEDLGLSTLASERGNIPIWRINVLDYVSRLVSTSRLSLTPGSVGSTPARDIPERLVVGSRVGWRLEVSSAWSRMGRDVSLGFRISMFDTPQSTRALIVLSPWPLPGDHFHLPYNIEKQCQELPFKEWDERNSTVLLLAKRSGESSRCNSKNGLRLSNHAKSRADAVRLFLHE